MPHHKGGPFGMRERGKGHLHVLSELDVVSQAFRGRCRVVHQRHRIVFRSFFMDSRLEFSRSEEHTSELQSRSDLVCRLLLEKKKLAGWLPGSSSPSASVATRRPLTS